MSHMPSLWYHLWLYSSAGIQVVEWQFHTTWNATSVLWPQLLVDLMLLLSLDWIMVRYAHACFTKIFIWLGVIFFLFCTANCGHPELLLMCRNSNHFIPKVVGYDNLPIEGSTIAFSCPPESVLTGPNSATCSENGEWEPDPSGLMCNESGYFFYYKWFWISDSNFCRPNAKHVMFVNSERLGTEWI